MRLRNPFRVLESTAVYRTAWGSVVFNNRPFVTRFSLYLVEQAMTKPEALGYRMVGRDVWSFSMVGRDVWSFSAIYARPLFLWALCKIGWWLGARRVDFTTWLFVQGLIDYTGPEEEVFQWRYVRPGKRLLFWRRR